MILNDVKCFSLNFDRWINAKSEKYGFTHHKDKLCQLASEFFTSYELSFTFTPELLDLTDKSKQKINEKYQKFASLGGTPNQYWDMNFKRSQQRTVRAEMASTALPTSLAKQAVEIALMVLAMHQRNASMQQNTPAPQNMINAYERKKFELTMTLATMRITKIIIDAIIDKSNLSLVQQLAVSQISTTFGLFNHAYRALEPERLTRSFSDRFQYLGATTRMPREDEIRLLGLAEMTDDLIKIMNVVEKFEMAAKKLARGEAQETKVASSEDEFIYDVD